MSIFGLMTKKEYAKIQAELEAMKATFAPYERWQLETARAEQYNIPDPSIYDGQAHLYRIVSWITQCVEITANAAALTPFGVKRLVSGKEPKDIPNHPFEMLLARPNPLDSRFEFLYATIAMYMMNGNAYWWLNRSDENSPPDELWYIPPSMIKPIPDERLFLRGYYYYPGTGEEIFIPTHEIVQFKRFNPFSRFIGLSAVESIALAAGGDIAMQRYNARIYGENNGRLPGILAFEEMIADPTWKDIKDQTREASRLREMLMLRGVGKGGVSWQQNAISQKEMEYLASREFNKTEIQNTLAPGLSTWLSENSTLANSTSNRAAFNELTLYPKHVLMAEKITNSILPAYTGRPLIGQFEDIRISDRQMQLEEQRLYAESHTMEEVREEFYGDDPLGDERDNLLPKQINSGSGKAEDMNTQPIPPELRGENDQREPGKLLDQSNESEDTTQEETEDEGTQAQKAHIEALARYERYAIRKIGEPLKFANDQLPDTLIAEIAGKLKACKSAAEIKAVFKPYKKRGMVSEAALVLEGIKLALGKL